MTLTLINKISFNQTLGGVQNSSIFQKSQKVNESVSKGQINRCEIE